jgi:hypothetical protein
MGLQIELRYYLRNRLFCARSFTNLLRGESFIHTKKGHNEYALFDNHVE